MPSRFLVRCAAKTLRHKGVIAYPTESVYGLGCDPLSFTAVNRILELKQRPVSKGLILIASNLLQLEAYININETYRETINSHPTPMTWLVNVSPLTPDWIKGDHQKVAVRVSQHSVVKELCNAFNGPIVSTSANPAGARAAANILQVRQYFPHQLDMYLSGNTGQIKLATPITDIETGQIIRG